MLRNKSDIKLTDGRLAIIKFFLSKEIDKSKYDMTETIKDLRRARGLAIYFNGKRAFPDSAVRNETTIPRSIERHLKGTNPIIIEYIKRYGHQNGYMNISETSTKPILIERNILINADHCRYDYISNLDGSVTFVERFSIEQFIDLSKKETPTIQLETKGPIATVETKSTIRVVDGKIVHTLDSDKITLLDELGTQLFNDTDGDIKHKYPIFVPSTLLTVMADLNKQCEEFKDQLVAKMASILAKHDVLVSYVEPTVTQDRIKKYLSGDGKEAISMRYEAGAAKQEFNLLVQQFKLVESSQVIIKPNKLDSYEKEVRLRKKITSFSNSLFTKENEMIFKKSEDGLGLKFLKLIADILTLGKFHEKLFRPTDLTLFSRNMKAVERNSYEPAAKKAKY